MNRAIGEASLTQRGAARSSAGVGDLLTIGVDTPALTDASVALCGLIGSVFVALWDVVTHSWPRTEEREDAGAGGGSLGALSVALTLGLLSLWEPK